MNMSTCTLIPPLDSLSLANSADDSLCLRDDERLDFNNNNQRKHKRTGSLDKKYYHGFQKRMKGFTVSNRSSLSITGIPEEYPVGVKPTQSQPRRARSLGERVASLLHLRKHNKDVGKELRKKASVQLPEHQQVEEGKDNEALSPLPQQRSSLPLEVASVIPENRPGSNMPIRHKSFDSSKTALSPIQMPILKTSLSFNLPTLQSSFTSTSSQSPNSFVAKAVTYVESALLEKRVVQRANEFIAQQQSLHAIHDMLGLVKEVDAPGVVSNDMMGDSSRYFDAVSTREELSSRSFAIAPFHRKEILVGQLLGQGEFSSVYEIAGIVLQDDKVATDVECTPQEHQARQVYQQQTARWLTEDSDRSTKNIRHRQYALKHLSRKLLRHPQKFNQAALDLRMEAHLMARLNHPNILALRGIAAHGLERSSPCNGCTPSEDNATYGDMSENSLAGSSSHGNSHNKHDSFFLITDRLVETLDQRIHRTWRTKETEPTMLVKVRYALQLAEALAYLHELKIAVRDIKGENIGFDEEGVMKLFDLGCCRSVSSGDHVGAAMVMPSAGTPRYMSPELLLHQPSGLAADVYSFAMVVYELLSGDRPFGCVKDVNELIQRVGVRRERPDVDLCHAPSKLENLLREAWHADPHQRPSMQNVCDQLRVIYRKLERKEALRWLSPSSIASAATNFAKALVVWLLPILLKAVELSFGLMFHGRSALARRSKTQHQQQTKATSVSSSRQHTPSSSNAKRRSRTGRDSPNHRSSSRGEGQVDTKLDAMDESIRSCPAAVYR